MKIEKLPSGSYRIRQAYKGQRYSIVVDHKPSQKEALLLMSDKLQDVTGSTGTFNAKAREYIDSKSNILSPSTIGGYEKILRNISDDFKKLNINDIDQLDVQKEINRYADGRSPKSVRNLHGFISSVLSLFRPNMVLRTTLPQKIKYEGYVPTEDDIRKILTASSGTPYHVPFQLGVLGMRRSEVCAASPDDIHGNMLSIDKALVYDKDNKLITKLYTKTTEGKRSIFLPDSLISEINSQGKVFDMLPSNLVAELHRIQKRLSIPEFRFHDLRHFYASYSHEQGMSDADIMASGGWSSDYVMKSVYRHSMEKSKEENQMKIANGILA